MHVQEIVAVATQFVPCLRVSSGEAVSEEFFQVIDLGRGRTCCS